MASGKNCSPEKETVGDVRNDRRRFLKVVSTLAATAYVVPSVVTLSMSKAYGNGTKKPSGC